MNHYEEIKIHACEFYWFESFSDPTREMLKRFVAWPEKISVLQYVIYCKLLCVYVIRCVVVLKPYEPPHDKTNKMTIAPSENSDQPRHPPSLITVFAVRMKKHWVLSYTWSASEDSGRCPGWYESPLSAHAIFVGFVMRRLVCYIADFYICGSLLNCQIYIIDVAGLTETRMMKTWKWGPQYPVSLKGKYP